MKKRALIHVSNTEHLSELAAFLNKNEWQIISANSTEKFLNKIKIPVTHEPVLESKFNITSEYAKLEQQILAVKSIEDSYNTSQELSYLDSQNEISLVCINFPVHLYNYTQEHQVNTLSRPEIFFITSLLRTAYYNSRNVLVLTDPTDYKEAMIQLRTGNITQNFRNYLAGKALNLISAYDAGLAYSILHSPQVDTPFMNYLTLPYTLGGMLKSGANKFQQAGIYYYPILNDENWGANLLNPEKISYTTINDLSIAWGLISTLFHNLKNLFTVQSTNSDGYAFTTQFTPLTGTVFTIAVKFDSIVGAALSTNAVDSFHKTNSFDKDITEVALGCSCVIDKEVASEIIKENYIAIVAPDFTPEAREILSQRSDMILLTGYGTNNTRFNGKIINGGLLVQSSDSKLFDHWNVKTKNRPNQEQTDAMAFGTLISLGCRSYSAVLLKENHILGIAQGCTSNKKAVDIAFSESQEKQGQTPEILVCDTPVVFTDTIKQLIDNGIHAIIQPGGTPNDNEFIKYCDEHNTVMIFTDLTHIHI